MVNTKAFHGPTTLREDSINSEVCICFEVLCLFIRYMLMQHLSCS